MAQQSAQHAVRDRLFAVAMEKGLRQSTVLSYERLLGRLGILDDVEVSQEDVLSRLWSIDNPNTRRPSTATIARHTGLSESTVKRRMAVLRDTGWLAPTGGTRGRGVRVYDLHVGHTDPEVVQPDTEVGQPETAGVSAGPTEEVHEQVKEDDQEEVMTGATAPVGGNVSSSKEEGEECGLSLCRNQSDARSLGRKGVQNWNTRNSWHGSAGIRRSSIAKGRPPRARGLTLGEAREKFWTAIGTEGRRNCCGPPERP